MVNIKFGGPYYETLRELLEEQPDLSVEIDKKIKLFQKNPNDTRLDNHQLTKRLEDKWAFSVTDDVRIIYEWSGKNTARFLVIGGHSRVYGQSSN